MPREFKIQITTAADTTGADKAEASFNKLKVSTEGLSQATRGQLGILSEHEKAQQKVNQATGDAEAKIRDEHRAMAELNRFIPGLGEALHGLKEGGLSAGFLGGVAGLQMLTAYRDHLIDIEQKARAAFVALQEGAIAAAKQITALKRADDEYWQDRQRHLQEEQDKNQYDLAIKKIQEQLDAEKKLAEAQKQSALDQVARALQENHISPGEAQIQQTEIEARFRNMLAGKETGAVAAEIAERQQRIDEQQAKIDAQTNLLKRAQEIDAGATGAGLRGDISQFENFKKLVQDRTASNEAIYSEEVPEAVKALLDWKHNPMSSIGFSMGSNFDVNTIQGWINANQKQLDDSARTQDLLKKDIENEQGIIDQLKAQNQDARQQQGLNPASRIAALQNSQDALKTLSALGIFGQGGFFPDPRHHNQQLYFNPEAQSIFEQGAAAIQAGAHLRPGQRLSDSQNEAINRFHQLEQAMGWGPGVIAAIDRLIVMNHSMWTEMRAMQTRLGQLENQIRSGAIHDSH